MAMQKSESIAEISKALAKFHEEVKQPHRSAENPFFNSKYVPLEHVVEAITECASKLGLSFVQWPVNDENGRVGVATMLMHSSGEYIEFDPVFMNAEKSTPQGAGSLITYLKRYSLSAVFGITSDIDDDANTFENPQNNQPPQQNNKASGQKKQLSEKQVKRLYAIASSAGFSTADVKKVLMKDYNKTNAADLTRQEYDELIERMEKKGA